TVASPQASARGKRPVERPPSRSWWYSPLWIAWSPRLRGWPTATIAGANPNPGSPRHRTQCSTHNRDSARYCFRNRLRRRRRRSNAASGRAARRRGASSRQARAVGLRSPNAVPLAPAPPRVGSDRRQALRSARARWRRLRKWVRVPRAPPPDRRPSARSGGPWRRPRARRVRHRSRAPARPLQPSADAARESESGAQIRPHPDSCRPPNIPNERPGPTWRRVPAPPSRATPAMPPSQPPSPRVSWLFRRPFGFRCGIVQLDDQRRHASSHRVEVEAETLIQQTRHVLDLYTQADPGDATFAGPTQHRQQQRGSHPVPSKLLAHADPQLWSSLVDEPSQVILVRPQTQPGSADVLALAVSRNHAQVPLPTPAVEHLGQFGASQRFVDARARRRDAPVGGLEQHLAQKPGVLRTRTPYYERFYPIFVRAGHPAGVTSKENERVARARRGSKIYRTRAVDQLRQMLFE